MSKRRLPPMERGRRRVSGPRIESYTVGSWCPAGTSTAVGVALAIQIADVEAQIVLRMNTPEAVDTMIQALLRHKRDVWPEAR